MRAIDSTIESDGDGTFQHSVVIEGYSDSRHGSSGRWGQDRFWKMLLRAISSSAIRERSIELRHRSPQAQGRRGGSRFVMSRETFLPLRADVP
jgi:hypothetical protein